MRLNSTIALPESSRSQIGLRSPVINVQRIFVWFGLREQFLGLDCVSSASLND